MCCARRGRELLDAWVTAQLAAPEVRTDLISERELRIGLTPPGVRTALTVERGMAMLPPPAASEDDEEDEDPGDR